MRYAGFRTAALSQTPALLFHAMDPSQPLIDEARQKAFDVLQRCATPHGFRASGMAGGYPQIWARDSMLVFLGAAATGDSTLLAAGRASLRAAGTSPRTYRWLASPSGLPPIAATSGTIAKNINRFSFIIPSSLTQYKGRAVMGKDAR